MPSKNYALGLMSGTSCDGLTLAVVQLSPFRVVTFENYPYTAAWQNSLLRARQLRAPELAALHTALGRLYAQKTKLFLKKHHLPISHLLCVGMHGQTVCHAPQAPVPYTLQIADPSFLAVQLNVPVVSNFREKDIALGGQGAPLMPFFDEFIFGKGAPKILLNLGGIANISVVGKNIKTYGFDCGPANTLMDLACQQYLHIPFDRNGMRAAKGNVDKPLVSRLLKQKFFTQKPPKSLDKNDFAVGYLKKYFSGFGATRINDLLATLNYFTAACIAKAITDFVPAWQRKEMIVSGGGAYNKTLLAHLRRLTGLPVCLSDQYGIPVHAKEAAAFALFAARAIQGKDNHCPYATGAREKTILGRITL